METFNSLPLLTAPEIRVLGALMEKSKTTPDYYPMTLNALVAACNQKTSRSPVVEYDEATVVEALDGLKGRSLVATAIGGGSRVTKYKHNFGTVYPVSDAALAIMCLLFLRGPQTPGELNTNSGRLYEFSSLDSVSGVLNELSSEEPAFVKELSKRPGQKEARFVHLFGDVPEHSVAEVIQPSGFSHKAALEERVSYLERELAALKEALKDLLPPKDEL